MTQMTQIAQIKGKGNKRLKGVARLTERVRPSVSRGRGAGDVFELKPQSEPVF